jgi:outer membrane protein assembly factor BamB/cbb3-type cytochrome oxidase subunit 3
MFINNAQNVGNSSSEGPLTSTILWTVPNVGGNGYSSPAVANGRVFINRGGSGLLYCLYETNGTEIWNTPIGTAGEECSTPAVYNGKVYIVGDRIRCFYENNGTEVWNKLVSGNGTGTSSTTVADGKVFLNTENLYCFNAENGTEVWSIMDAGGDMQSSTPAYSNGRVYVNAGKLACYYANNGTEIWNRSGVESSNPVIINGKIYWSPQWVFCLYESNGTEIWKNTDNLGDGFSTLAIYQDKLFTNNNGNIYCLYENNGTEIWQSSIAGTGCSSPSVDALGNVYITGGPYAYCLNGTNGNEIWSENTGSNGWSSAAISNGRVFINQGDVYCFGTPPYSIDYIQIRDAPDGEGFDLCDPANYPIFPIAHSTTFYAAAYNSSAPDDGYLGDVPFSFNWLSSNDTILYATPTGTSSNIFASFSDWGTVTVTLSDDQGNSNTTQVTVLEPIVDYVLIRDGPNGGGMNLCDPGNYPTYPLAFEATFYGAEYNQTVGFLGDVSSSSTWISDNENVVNVTSPGGTSSITCSSTNNGTVTITLDAGGGNTNSTQITVLDAQIDYILIRDAPDGGGNNLCEPGNYVTCSVGYLTMFYAASYNGSDYLSDVPVSWSSYNESLVTVTEYGEFTLVTCSDTLFGSVSILADYSYGVAESTIITILPPSVNYIQIRDESHGGGTDLCDPANYPSFPVGANFTLFGARYNVTAGFLDEVPSSSIWESYNESIISGSSRGVSSLFACSQTEYGTVIITLSDGEGHSNSTQVTVLEPTVDFIQIRDAPGNLGNVTLIMDYKLGEIEDGTFYCAVYNTTAGYLGERPALWELDKNIGNLSPQLGYFANFSATTFGVGNISADLNGLIVRVLINVEPEDIIMDSPTGLIVDVVEGGGALRLSWDHYIWTNLAGYRIYRSADGGFSYDIVNPGALIINNSYLDSGLTNGVIYHYYVTAMDNASNESPSSSIKYNTPKGEPKEEEEQDFGWILLVFILILILVIILIFILMRRKKEEAQKQTFIADMDLQDNVDDEPQDQGEPPLNNEMPIDDNEEPYYAYEE